MQVSRVRRRELEDAEDTEPNSSTETAWSPRSRHELAPPLRAPLPSQELLLSTSAAHAREVAKTAHAAVESSSIAESIAEEACRLAEDNLCRAKAEVDSRVEALQLAQTASATAQYHAEEAEMRAGVLEMACAAQTERILDQIFDEVRHLIIIDTVKRVAEDAAAAAAAAAAAERAEAEKRYFAELHAGGPELDRDGPLVRAAQLRNRMRPERCLLQRAALIKGVANSQCA